jgi:hypothetical protein
MTKTVQLVILLAFAFLLLFVSAVHSQDTVAPPEHLTEQLALGRIGASEIGLTGTPAELAAIHEVLSNQAARHGWTLLGTMRRYSSMVFDQSRHDGRAWVAFLRADGRAPQGWPTQVQVRRHGELVTVPHAPWGTYRERWLTLYETAGRVLRGEVTSPCVEPVLHWGGDMDRARAEAHGLLEIECGETRNHFYALPPRGDRD